METPDRPLYGLMPVAIGALAAHPYPGARQETTSTLDWPDIRETG
jgi:hypothetical protein